MATINVSKQVGSPTDVVFERFTDIEGIPGRLSRVKSIEMLTPGAFRLGTRWRETREVLGRLDTSDMEVTAYERNRTYTITHRRLGARIDTTFTFEPVNGGTRVNVELNLSGPGMPPGLLAPVEWVLAGKVREVLSRDLTELTDAVQRAA